MGPRTSPRPHVLSRAWRDAGVSALVRSASNGDADDNPARIEAAPGRPVDHLGQSRLELELAWRGIRRSPVSCQCRRCRFELHQCAIAEIVTADAGHVPASDRLGHTGVGAQMRYVDHREWSTSNARVLEIDQAFDDLQVTSDSRRLTVPAVRATVCVANGGSSGSSFALWRRGWGGSPTLRG